MAQFRPFHGPNISEMSSKGEGVNFNLLKSGVGLYLTPGLPTLTHMA